MPSAITLAFEALVGSWNSNLSRPAVSDKVVCIAIDVAVGDAPPSRPAIADKVIGIVNVGAWFTIHSFFYKLVSTVRSQQDIQNEAANSAHDGVEAQLG